MSSPGTYDNDDLDFMPDVHAAIRRRGRRFAYLLTVMGAVVFIVMGVWANFAVLDEVTRGEGQVIPSRKTQVIQNLEGGILAEILVQEGDIVERGAILIRIDNSVAQAGYRDVRGQYYTLLATITRLEAEFEGSKLVFSKEILKEAAEEAADQMRLYNARKNQLRAQVAVLKAQASQRTQETAEMDSRRKQLERSLVLARQEMAITEPLVKKGIMPRIELLRIERQVADLEGEISTINVSIPRLKTAASEARRRTEELVATSKTEVSIELNRIRAEFNSISETLFAGKDRVTRTEVRSPVRGTIKDLKQTTVGGVIRPGEDILEIVPLDDSLLIEARIRPADIAFLRPGQQSTVKVTAYDFSIYGGLKATLERISAGTLKDEQGESYYRAYLRTDQNSLIRHGEELPIIPGMTATVEILTGKKTVLDYILKPILKTRDRALTER